MSDTPQEIREPPQPTPAATQPDQPAFPLAMPGPPPSSAAVRVRLAAQRRGESDYIFSYWSALGWTILTLGIYGLYVFYQLVRRMRDHNARRLELLDAAATFAWEQAGRQGRDEELAPAFQRAAGHLAVLRRMTGDFREAVIWLLLAIVARGITEIVAFVLLDQDLIKHSRAEGGARARAVGDLRPARTATGLSRSEPGEAAGQLRRPYRGRDLLARHLHVLVVLQPDGGAEQALRRQLGSRGRAGKGRGCAQLVPRSHPGSSAGRDTASLLRIGQAQARRPATEDR